MLGVKWLIVRVILLDKTREPRPGVRLISAKDAPVDLYSTGLRVSSHSFRPRVGEPGIVNHRVVGQGFQEGDQVFAILLRNLEASD